MTGLSLVTRGFICDYRLQEGGGPAPIVGGGGVIREEYEKPKPTIKVIKAFTENEVFLGQMKNVTIDISGVSIKLGD